LTASGINILNIGNKPTFVNAIRSEVLDLTLSTQFISNFVFNWHVSDEPSLSDHMHIKFELESVNSTAPLKTIPKKTDWTRFKCSLISNHFDPPISYKSTNEIDLVANGLNVMLKTAYDDSCVTARSTHKRIVPWWNPTLAYLRKSARKEFNRAKRTGRWDAYKSVLNKYNNERRKSKRLTWQKTCTAL